MNVDSNIDEMDKRLDNLKVSLYNAHISLQSLSVKSIRKELKQLKDKIDSTLNQRRSLNYVTLDGYASSIKQQYIIYSTLYHENGNKIWKDFNDVEFSLIYSIIKKIYEFRIDMDRMRELARTEPWRSHWGADKQNIFEKSVINLSDEQRILLLYSKMYDNAYEHPECPSDEIIEDDDMFDGWMIRERNKRNKERETSAIEKNINAKHSRAQEVFIPVETMEDAKKLSQLNSPHAQAIKKQRLNLIKEKSKRGEVTKDIEFMDKRLELQQQQVQQMTKHIKGK